MLYMYWITVFPGFAMAYPLTFTSSCACLYATSSHRARGVSKEKAGQTFVCGIWVWIIGQLEHLGGKEPHKFSSSSHCLKQGQLWGQASLLGALLSWGQVSRISHPSRTPSECGISLKSSYAQSSRDIWAFKNLYFCLSGLCITPLRFIPSPHSGSPQRVPIKNWK